jgi:solute carrier family 35 (UDP-galactose transporter), member B1
MSIQHVSYPTMTLAKSCKPIPVLVTNLFLGRVPSRSRVLCVVLITWGVALFFWDRPHEAPSSLGAMLLGLSLALDGVTGPLQDVITLKYRPSSTLLMARVNLLAALVLLPCILFYP